MTLVETDEEDWYLKLYYKFYLHLSMRIRMLDRKITRLTAEIVANDVRTMILEQQLASLRLTIRNWQEVLYGI